GSRLFRAHGPLMNIHSLAGAIGMGLPMAVGTAIANPQRKVVGRSASALTALRSTPCASTAAAAAAARAVSTFSPRMMMAAQSP
ncbi:hypothetical protein, partial [Klebsiella pneumoniae]|uniref:hypothetical protein n=1 Tax=Klebsiella pneumoniae TaxID=573 RepID=UPI004044AF75